MQILAHPSDSNPESDEAWDFVDDPELLLSFAPVSAAGPARGVGAGPMAARAYVAPGLGLGPAPTENEAADAARLLRASLAEYTYVDAGADAEERSAQGQAGHVPRQDQVQVRGFSGAAARLVSAARANAAHGRRAVVSQALHLFSTNHGVQRAVRSLCCDPAVWQAVSNNPEVRRLINSPGLLAPAPEDEQDKEEHEEDDEEVPLPPSRQVGGIPAQSPALAARLRQLVASLVKRWMDLGSSWLGGLARMLGLHSHSGSGEGSPSADEDDEGNKHLLPGIVAVAVLVIAIIVLKRPIII